MATTNIESVLMDADFDKPPFDNLAVLALFKGKSESRQFESQAVAALRNKFKDTLINSSMNEPECP